MRRRETTLVVFAVVVLIGAWELSSDTAAPSFSSTGAEIPWSVLLWQFRHALAPALAVVGLASAVGILFLRAVQWVPRTFAEPPSDAGGQASSSSVRRPPSR